MGIRQVIIIGSGPAGYSAAIYLARADLKPLIVAGNTPGGQLTQTSEVENYPGYDSILGLELTNKWKQHAEKFGTEILTGTVTQLINDKILGIKLSSGEIYQAKTILITTGASALWLEIPSEQKFKGKGVSACATCDGFFFKNKKVAVIGGGDTALEEALFLTKFADKVYIIHRRNQFRASKIMQQRVIKNANIEILWNTEVDDIFGDQKVESIKIKTNDPRIIKQFNNLTINLDGVFIAIGHKPNTEFLSGSGVELDEKGYIITTSRFVHEFSKLKIKSSKFKVTIPHFTKTSLGKQNSKLKDFVNKFNLDYQTTTSVKGVFAAGDCVDYQYRQASTAVGMGVAASLEIEKYLDSNV